MTSAFFQTSWQLHPPDALLGRPLNDLVSRTPSLGKSFNRLVLVSAINLSIKHPRACLGFARQNHPWTARTQSLRELHFLSISLGPVTACLAKSRSGKQLLLHVLAQHLGLLVRRCLDCLHCSGRTWGSLRQARQVRLKALFHAAWGKTCHQYDGPLHLCFFWGLYALLEWSFMSTETFCIH